MFVCLMMHMSLVVKQQTININNEFWRRASSSAPSLYSRQLQGVKGERGKRIVSGEGEERGRHTVGSVAAAAAAAAALRW